MSAFDNSSKPPTENQWHPMGSGFTAADPPSSTPPAPRESWAQRMSRRITSVASRDPRDPATLRLVGHATRAVPPRPQSAHNVTTKQRAGEQEEVDQLTAFRTGAFDGLDARNGAAP